MKKQLARAEVYLLSFKNDSALVVAGGLVQELKSAGTLDTPFGIQSQLIVALAIEQDQAGNLAIERLLEIAQKSKKKELWREYVRACLALALLYEKVNLKDSSREQLDLAITHIDRDSLHSLYPYYAIRRASWERLYGDRETGVYYAKQALQTAPKYHQVLEEAISHLLLNLLLPESSLNERMFHCQAAVRLYIRLGDHTGCSYMYAAISKIYNQRKNNRLALAYNDSTLVEAHRAIAEGHEKFESIGSHYLFRSKIFMQMEQLDSALVNMQKGYETELSLKEKDVSDKIVEIDARYQNKYKQQLIERELFNIYAAIGGQYSLNINGAAILTLGFLW